MTLRKDPFFVYADTSVFGGVFDDEFSQHSRTFFEEVRSGRFKLFVSEVVRVELESAPDEVRAFFYDIAPGAYLAAVTPEAISLMEAYLREGVVGPKSTDDALHVALATVSGCDIIVSWNFKHIVNFQKIPLFNAVNALNGYGAIAIHSPMEVVPDDEE